MLKKITIALWALAITIVGTSIVFAQNQNHKMKTTFIGAPAKNTLVMITPSDITWTDGLDAFPAGSQMALLDGDPKVSGMYTIRMKLPANYQIPPHFANTPKKVTVISGTLNVGSGDKMDTSSGTALAAGSFLSVPANAHIYGWTNEETVVQVAGQGPLMIKYVNSNDDPRKAGKMAKPANQMQVGPAAPMTPSTPSTPSTPAPATNTSPSSNY